MLLLSLKMDEITYKANLSFFALAGEAIKNIATADSKTLLIMVFIYYLLVIKYILIK